MPNEPEVNFRIAVRFLGEEKERITTLAIFLAENEGAPAVCDIVAALEPGQEKDVGAMKVRRFPQNEVRFSHFKVPIRFDGVTSATITIDRKRNMMLIRPSRRRSVCEIDLGDLAQRMLEKQARLNILEKKKARKKARLIRRKAA